MKAEIKDKSKNITRALNLLGYRVNNVQVEIILNVAEFVNNTQGETTIKDLVTIESLVEGLFED